MKFARVTFLVAGIYGLIGLTPLYFLEGMIGRQTSPPITHAEFYYGFIGTALAWQFVFLVIARDPVRYRLLMLPSILEKIAYGIPVLVLYLQHRIAAASVAISIVDWSFAVLFALSYACTQSA
jgi:hypothetical protein